MCLYVDDMLILNDYIEGIIEKKKFIPSTFEVRDLGEVDTIFCIKLNKNSWGAGYLLNQTHYTKKV